jgi:hypothetical protein
MTTMNSTTTKLFVSTVLFLVGATGSVAEIRDRELAQQELELLKPCVDAEKARMEQFSGKNADPRDLAQAKFRHQELLTRQEYLTANMPSKTAAHRSDSSAERAQRAERRAQRSRHRHSNEGSESQVRRQYQPTQTNYRQTAYRQPQYQPQRVYYRQQRVYQQPTYQQPTYRRPHINKEQLKGAIFNLLRGGFRR